MTPSRYAGTLTPTHFIARARKACALLWRVTIAVFSGALLLVLTGCFDRTEEYFLNPDGSGKVVYSINNGADTELSQARTTLMEIPSQPSGMAGWGHPFITNTADAVIVGITGYFTNFQQVQVRSRSIDFKPAVNPDGTWTISWSPNESRAASNTVAMSPEQIDAFVQKAAQESKAMMKNPMLRQVMQRKQTFLYHLPGPVQSLAGFKKLDERTVRIELQGTMMVEAMTKLAESPELLRKACLSGGARKMNGEPDLEALARQMALKDAFGVDDRIYVTWQPETKPLFNFAEELKTASPKPDTEFFVRNNIVPGKVPAPPKMFEEVKFTLTKVQANPKGFWGPSIDVSWKVVAPAGLNLIPLRTELFLIQTDGGGYLEPGQSRTIAHGSSLMDPVRGLTATASLKGDSSLTNIARLTGSLKAGTFTRTNEVDLGEIELKPGAKGSKLGLRIVDMSSMGSGNNSIGQIVVDTDKVPGLARISFCDAEGKELFVVGGTPEKKTERTLMRLGNTRELPARATAKAVVYENYQETEIPFELKP